MLEDAMGIALFEREARILASVNDACCRAQPFDYAESVLQFHRQRPGIPASSISSGVRGNGRQSLAPLGYKFLG
jgi:hypothetical protein